MPVQRIPIFPLNVVVFPGMALPLHIFEPRYQLMTRRCLDGDRTFGVCLIRSGLEVGASAEPYPVGTTCEIVASEPLGDGRWNLHTVGRRRFRILELFQDEPYLQADVEFLAPETVPEELADLPERVRAATEGYVRAILSANGLAYRDLELPQDPLQLSYLVGAVLQGDPRERQELLEIDEVGARLEREAVLLEQETARVRERGRQPLTARPLQPDPSSVSLN